MLPRITKKQKKLAAGVLAAYLLYKIMKTHTISLHRITDKNEPRGCDGGGCGHFGASRNGRKHNGFDIVVSKGETIFSPISGKVSRYAFPYADDKKYTGIVIENDFVYIKMFYMLPIVKVGTTIQGGQVIGVAQDISEKHGSGMKPHVHIEVYRKEITGLKLIDPTYLFN